MIRIKTNTILISFLMLLFILLAVFILLGKSIFTLNKVKFSADFDIDKEKLIQFLDIYPKRILFSYNTDEMNRKLSELSYLKSYSVSKEYPNALLIKLRLKKSVAKVAGENGKLFLVDDSGIVYKEVVNNFDKNPTLIFQDSSKIKNGIIISGKYTNLINELSLLSSSFHDIYDAISQIEIYDDRNDEIAYRIYFKTIDNYIYLKKNINVDCINKGLAACLFYDMKNIKNKRLYYTNNAFVVM